MPRRSHAARRRSAFEVIVMSRGGARNRSGPAKQENSGRSDRAGYSLSALPAEGYAGPVPDFPLPRRSVFYFEQQDKARVRVFDADATRETAERELELWAEIWTYPQACAWSLPSEAWRLHTIAMFVRTFVVCEGSDATAADKNSLHRFADQIGMTTAGLAEMGWKIVPAMPSDSDDQPAEGDQDAEATGTDGVVTPFERRR
jgi:hypothetical protein